MKEVTECVVSTAWALRTPVSFFLEITLSELVEWSQAAADFYGRLYPKEK